MKKAKLDALFNVKRENNLWLVVDDIDQTYAAVQDEFMAVNLAHFANEHWDTNNCLVAAYVCAVSC